MADFDQQIDQHYQSYYHNVLNIQKEHFLTLNQGKDLSLFNHLFPHFYSLVDIEPLKKILDLHYNGVHEFFSFNQLVHIGEKQDYNDLFTLTSHDEIISLLNKSDFFSKVNDITSEKNQSLLASFFKSSLNDVQFNLMFERYNHFDQLLKSHNCFITAQEVQLKHSDFKKGLFKLKESIELIFQEFYKNSSLFTIRNLSSDKSKNDFHELLSAQKDLSIYYMPLEFKYNLHYFLCSFYCHADIDITDKLMARYPMTPELIDYIKKQDFFENTVIAKILLHDKLIEKLPENRGKVLIKL